MATRMRTAIRMRWAAGVVLLATATGEPVGAQTLDETTTLSQQRALAVLRAGIEASGGMDRLGSLNAVAQRVQSPGWMVGQGVTPSSEGPPAAVSYTTLVTDRGGDRESMDRFATDTSSVPRSRTVRTPEEIFLARFWNGTVMDIPAGAPPLGLGMPFVGFHLLDAWDRWTTLRYLARSRVGGRSLDVITYSDEDGLQTSLGFDTESRLLVKLAFLGPLSPYGLAEAEVEYSDYREIDGLMVPFTATQRQAGLVARRTSLEDLDLDPPIDDSLFARPAGLQTQPAAGGGGAAPPPEERVEQIADGVYLIRRPGVNYHSLFVEEDDYVIAVEPVLNPTIGERMLRTIEETIPDKPVKYLILTHHHFDHSGGLWPFLAAGVTIVTTPGNEAFIRQVADGPPPREFAGGEREEPRIEVVRGHAVYGVGSNRIELYDFGPNPHADEILVPYLPEHRIAYTADIYGWGMRGTPAPILRAFADKLDALGLDVELFYSTHADPPLTLEQYREEVAQARGGG